MDTRQGNRILTRGNSSDDFVVVIDTTDFSGDSFTRFHPTGRCIKDDYHSFMYAAVNRTEATRSYWYGIDANNANDNCAGNANTTVPVHEGTVTDLNALPPANITTTVIAADVGLHSCPLPPPPDDDDNPYTVLIIASGIAFGAFVCILILLCIGSSYFNAEGKVVDEVDERGRKWRTVL